MGIRMIEQKKFSGIMNLDDSPEMILPSQHRESLNIRFYGTQSGLICENIKGNTLVINPYLPSSGDNQSIGAYFDQLKQRVFSFNWNSLGAHGIYMYDINAGTFTRLIENFINSSSDILFFDLDFPIPSVNILYTTDEDGDILTWVQRNRRPAELNILSAINNLYGANWEASYLDVAKEPPSIPIQCAYEDDNTVTVNNLNPAKQIYKFKYRFIYDNFQKSVTSAQSDVPIPYNYTLLSNTTDPTKNARIVLAFQTGAPNVVKIELLAAQGLGDLFSDFFSIAILDKADLNIPDNDTGVFQFYNNEAYNYIDKAESIQFFDYVPYRANSQELLNGNVIDYAGIIEGLNPIVPDVSITQGVTPPLSIPDNVFMSVTQKGLGGFDNESTAIHVIIGGTPLLNERFLIYIFVSPTIYEISYTVLPGDTRQDVLDGLTLSANGQGFTVATDVTGRSIYIIRTGQVLQRTFIEGGLQQFSANGNYSSVNVISLSNSAQYIGMFPVGARFSLQSTAISNIVFTVRTQPTTAATTLIIPIVEQTNVAPIGAFSSTIYLLPNTNQSIFASDWSSKENLALQYFNDKGVTCGAVTSDNFNVVGSYINSSSSDAGTNQIDVFTLIVNNRPPIEATYFHVVHTKNLTKQTWLYWVSGGTYKDDRFAYISIAAIATYNLQYPSSKDVIGYEYTAGDRVKFCVRYNVDKTVNQNYGDLHDYEIVESRIAIENDVIPLVGQYIKIPLPEVSTAFNFGIPGATDNDTYNYYFIQLYTPAKSVANGLDVYYESLFRGQVGDAGLATRYHQGNLQNQTENLSLPARIFLRFGDAYYRQREINLGFFLQYAIENRPRIEPDLFGSARLDGFVPAQKLLVQSEKSDSFYANPQVEQQYINLQSQSGYTVKQIAKRDITIHATGTINIVADSNGIPGALYGFLLYYNVVGIVSDAIFLGTISSEVKVGDSVTIPFDVFFNIPAGTNNVTIPVFIRGTSSDANFYMTMQDGNFSIIETDKTFNIGIIDQNYSDFFESKGNSDGRPSVVDPEAGQRFYATLNRNSLAYIQNTSINKTNRFYAENFVEWDRSKGQVQRLKLRGTALRVFFERGVGVVPVNQNVLQTADSNNQVTQSSRLLNDIQYYQGEFGLGSQYCGLASSAGAEYFNDPVRGYQIRLSGDGMIPISELYKGQYWLRNLLTPYNKDYLRTDGSLAKIISYYDYFEEQFVTILQSGSLPVPSNTLIFVDQILEDTIYDVVFTGTPVAGYKVIITIENDNGNTGVFEYTIVYGETLASLRLGILAVVNANPDYVGEQNLGHVGIHDNDLSSNIIGYSTQLVYDSYQIIPNKAFSFNERRNGYCSFYSFTPEWIICAEDVTYSWLNGNLYIHNNTTNYCNFYGVQYDAYLVLVFNMNLLEKKSWESLSELANDIWECPEISTNLMSYGSTPQQSNLIPTDFVVLEQMPSASFLRDSNSVKGLINGDQLKGNWIQIKFQKTAATDLTTLAEVAIRFVDSPLSAK
jgi:hypothetical protein